MRGISLSSTETYSCKSKLPDEQRIQESDGHVPSDLSQKGKKLKIAKEMSMSIIQTLILLNTSEISGLKSTLSPNLWLSQSGILDQVYSY